MAEFLTLAEAVRGLKGQGSTVTHVGSPKPSASPAHAPAPAGQPADRRDYWTADQDNSLLEVRPPTSGMITCHYTVTAYTTHTVQQGSRFPC